MRFRSCILASCLLVTSSIFAQQEELFDQQWYLSELILNGHYIDFPENDEFCNAPLEFRRAEDNRSTVLDTKVCNWYVGEVEFATETNTFISYLGFSHSLVVCNIWENQEFENTYFSFYTHDVTYEYEISEEDDVVTLQIRNTDNGDVLTYTNINLSTSETLQEACAVYPNPAQDLLNLKGISAGSIISVYSRESKKVLETKFNNTALNISGLENGLYFMVLNDENKKQVLKFLKK